MLRAHLVIETLECGGALSAAAGLAGGGIYGDQLFEPGKSRADLAVLPGLQRLGIQIFLFAAGADELLLAAVHLGDHLRRAAVAGLELQHVLQGLRAHGRIAFCSMCCRARRNQSSIFCSLRRFSMELFSASPGPLAGSSASNSWIFCSASGYSSSSARVRALSSSCAIIFCRCVCRVAAAASDARVDVALGFQFAQNLVGELVIARLEALEARWMRGWMRAGSKSSMGSLREALRSASANSRAVEKRYHGGFAMALWTTRLIIALTKRVQLGSRRRNLFQDGVGHFR